MMEKTYRAWDPNQKWLFPPSVNDWLPEDDMVYFILDTVNELDISTITEKYEQEPRGYPPYHPRMMTTLLIYAYCRGIYSSRKIMQACEERLYWTPEKAGHLLGLCYNGAEPTEGGRRPTGVGSAGSNLKGVWYAERGEIQ